MTRVLAFDLGGTRLKAGVVLEGARVEDFQVADSSPEAATALATVERIGRTLQAKHRCDAVGLCVPGLVGKDGRVIALPGKLAGIVGRDLVGWLRERFEPASGSAVVVNDAIAFAVGEAARGAARGHERAVVVTIGTGVGVAVTQDGIPIGPPPLGGGLLGGQIPIAEDEEGPTDTNGKRGTIEALCAAQRLVDYANAAGGAFRSTREVYTAAGRGEDAAGAGIERYRHHLVRALVALAHAHAPSVILLGGGPMQADSPVFTGLEQAVRAHLWPGYAVEIRPAALGDDAALLGLAHLAVHAPEATSQARLPIHRRARASSYEKRPFVEAGDPGECIAGWEAIAAALRARGARVVVVETYPGVLAADLAALLRALDAPESIDAAQALKPQAAIERMVEADLGDDPVFGRLTALDLVDFFDPAELARLRDKAAATERRLVVHGTGASLVTAGDLLVYADMPRWEIQQRQRRGAIASLGATNFDATPSQKYKRGYFVDWRVADRHKRRVQGGAAYVLDTTRPDAPLMISGEAFRRALAAAVRRPFRVVPFFDPAPWGGQWMKEVCDLPRDAPNYGWCFDCVPEENSLLLAFGSHRFEIPAINLVFAHPEELLGARVRARFGEEFPIRFDFLDTMGGGNLSLQVHPSTPYMREHFGVGYTQDESYYLLDADEGASVYLGVKPGVDGREMFAALRRAHSGGPPFPAERYVNRFPAARHDHFLIPAGTVHCSGAGALVLEISATPYIFTFKLWDWGRMGLDGEPRPVHVDHGELNVRFERDDAYARARLINQVTPLGTGNGWRAERTGLHEAEFIETHRHWFTAPVAHDTGGGVNVLNLVEGEAAVVESPDGAFEPFAVHYAETFIVPAAVGAYTIRPLGRDRAERHATIKAFVRGGTRTPG